MREPIAQWFVLASEWLPARSHSRSGAVTAHALGGGAVALTVALLSVLLAACTLSLPWGVHIPTTLRTPTIAGVVVKATQLPNGHWQNELADGQIVEIDQQTISLLGGRRSAGSSSPAPIPTAASGCLAGPWKTWLVCRSAAMRWAAPPVTVAT